MVKSESANQFSGQLVRSPLFYRQWMLRGNPALYFDHIIRQFGDFVDCRGLFRFYLVNHPALVKQVLMNTHASFDKRSILYDRFRHAFGNGLVVSEGNQWKRQRKLMQPMFGPITVQTFFARMVSATESLLDQWNPRCQTASVFDVAEDMERITLQIAGEVLFSDGFSDTRDRIAHWTSTINHYSAKPPLPLIRQPWFPSRTNRNLQRTLTDFHSFIHELIAKRRSASEIQDLLGILLQAKHEDDDSLMSDHEISEEVLGMIIGGHETSSSALTWLWYELDRNREIQDQMLREVQSVTGSGPLLLEHLPRLRYTRMVIDECLRLHPPFWFENRNVMEDTELGGHPIKKGSMVVFSRYSLHRHPEFWEEPDRFKPLRQDPDAAENPRASYAQVPFGGGPRTSG